MGTDNSKGVRILSEEGGEMITLEAFGTEGNKITVQGALMGAWSTKMYIYPKDALKLLGFIFNLKLIVYFFRLPFILAKDKSK